MLHKIINNNIKSIQDSIKSNGSGSITGDLLQKQLLLLNRDMFGGELVDEELNLTMSSLINSLNNEYHRFEIGTDWFEFFKQYNVGTWDTDSNYVAIKENDDIVAYMVMWKSYSYGEDSIVCTFFFNAVNTLSRFIIYPESDDFEDNYFRDEEIRFTDAPAITLASNPDTRITEINGNQLEELKVSAYIRFGQDLLQKWPRIDGIISWKVEESNLTILQTILQILSNSGIDSNSVKIEALFGDYTINNEGLIKYYDLIVLLNYQKDLIIHHGIFFTAL